MGAGAKGMEVRGGGADGAGEAGGRRQGGGRGRTTRALRLIALGADAWRACGGEGGGSRWKILGWTALSRDLVCFFTPPVSRWAPRFPDCIRRCGAAH